MDHDENVPWRGRSSFPFRNTKPESQSLYQSTKQDRFEIGVAHSKDLPALTQDLHRQKSPIKPLNGTSQGNEQQEKFERRLPHMPVQGQWDKVVTTPSKEDELKSAGNQQPQDFFTSLEDTYKPFSEWLTGKKANSVQTSSSQREPYSLLQPVKNQSPPVTSANTVSDSDAKEPAADWSVSPSIPHVSSISSSGTDQIDSGKWYSVSAVRLKEWSKYFSDVFETIIPQELTANLKVNQHPFFGGKQKSSSSIFKGGLIANVATASDEFGEWTPPPKPHLDDVRSDSVSHVDSPAHLFDIQLVDVIQAAVTTVNTIREVPGDSTKQDLMAHIRMAFDLTVGEMSELCTKAAHQNSSSRKLMCNVVRGSDLISKDANGKSDPYVRLGIIDARRLNDSIIKTKNLVQWREEGGILPSGEVSVTSVKPATLSPAWDELVELAVSDVEEEMLVVEVWDSDDDPVKATKIKGFKGFRSFLADFRKGDDFMGRAFLSLKTLPLSEEVKSLKLYSHSGKHQYGSIDMRLVIEGVKSFSTIEAGMMEHGTLIQALVESESKVNGQYTRRWTGTLSPSAEKLLKYHYIYCVLDKIHSNILKFSVLMKYHRMFAIEMSTFISLIKEIKDLHYDEFTFIPLSSPTEPVSESMSVSLWASEFFNDLTDLAIEVGKTLKSHLTVFNIKEDGDVEKLRQTVELIRELYTFWPFVYQLSPEKQNLNDLLEEDIIESVLKWFLSITKMIPETDVQLAALKGVTTHVLNHSHRVLKRVAPIFQEIGVDYFTHFYLTVDKLISFEVISRLEGSDEPDDTNTYVVYHTLKDLRKLSQFVDEKQRGQQLLIQNFHSSFRGMVDGWIVLASERCKDHIRKAIQIDKKVQVTEEVKISSSAVDSMGFLIMLMKLVDDLEWPSPVEEFTFVVTVIKSVCDNALFYVGEVYKSLHVEDMYDKNGMFRASEKLSIVLNNTEHIKRILDMCRNRYAKETPPADNLSNDELRILEHSREVIKTFITCSLEDIDTMIANIVFETCRKIAPDVRRFLHDILSSEENLETRQLDSLMSYLAANLHTFSNYLLTQIFNITLANLWCISVDCLSEALEKHPAKNSNGMVNIHAWYVLEQLEKFFHAGGHGLSKENLVSENYKDLLAKLEILCLPTDQLIQHFYSQLAKQQQAEAISGEFPHGKLLLSVGYHKDKRIVEVNLFQGQKLSKLDSSGLRNPFVKLRLMPTWLFQKVPKKCNTSVKKKTLNPVFNEDFRLPADEHMLLTEGAILLLTVFDRDIITSDDYCGMCVVACKDIPFLTSSRSAFSDPQATERKNLTLPLFKLKKSSVALKELNSRLNQSDTRAIEFFKYNKHIQSMVNF